MPDDTVYCIDCTMYLSMEKQNSFGFLVNKGLEDYHNIHQNQRLHQGNQYHKDAKEPLKKHITQYLNKLMKL